MTIYESPYGPISPLPQTSVWNFVWSNPNNVSNDKLAVIDAISGEGITRQQLKEGAQKLAYGLVQRGLKPGQVVCVMSPNSIHYQLLIFACQCAGLVVSGANAAYTAGELAHQLTDASADLVLVHPDNLKVVLEATALAKWSKLKQKKGIIYAVKRIQVADNTWPAFDELMGGSKLEPVTIANPQKQIAYLGFSSGTTSAAKGVMTSHFNITSVLTGLAPMRVTQKDTLICVLPLNHIYGLVVLAHMPVLNGCTTVVCPKFDLQAFCATVQQYKVTVAFLVPPIILRLAREPLVAKYNLSSIRLVVSGAAPLSSSLELELEKRIGTNVRQSYGLTETSPTTHFCPIDKPKPGSSGWLLPNTRGRVVDPVTCQDVPPGQEGEVLLAGPLIMLGYLGRPKATAEAIVQGGWFRTGDIGYCDDNGYWYITDRIKEMIKYKGLQVYPAELEALLLTHPAVQDTGVIGVYVPDEASEFPRAYVVPSKPVSNPLAFELELQQFVAEKAANHKQLRGGVIILDAIPKSPSGKILRRVLKERAKHDRPVVLKRRSLSKL